MKHEIKLLVATLLSVCCHGFTFADNIEYRGYAFSWAFDNTNTDEANLYMAYSLSDEDIKPDTMYLPTVVEENGQEFPICGIEYTLLQNVTPKVLVISSSIKRLGEFGNSTFQKVGLEKILVSEDNPYFCSVDGILYSKDMAELISCPPSYPVDTLRVPWGVQTIPKSSFGEPKNLQYIEFPNTLKNMDELISLADKNPLDLLTVIFKDSLTEFKEFTGVRTSHNLKFVVGQGLKRAQRATAMFSSDENATISIVCRATTPPVIESSQFHRGLPDLYTHIYVPRWALELYKNASGWNAHTRIHPIEPANEIGFNHATIHWVPSFSATAYELRLYADKQQTVQVASVVLDADGKVQAEGIAPADLTQLETHYQDYYSYTFSDLQLGQKYYMELRYYAGDKVIDTVQEVFQAGHAQSNIELATHWKIVEEGSQAEGQPCWGEKNIYVEKDTLIHDTVYQKLSQGKGFIRHSADAMQMYYRSQSGEYLLCDFTLKLGDICYAYAGTGKLPDEEAYLQETMGLTPSWRVTAVSEVAGRKHITMRLVSDYGVAQAQMIQGVGSSHFIFPMAMPFDCLGCGETYTLCAFADDEQLYSFDLTQQGIQNDCTTWSIIPSALVDATAMDDFRVSIEDNQLFIHAEKPILTTQIYTATGQLVTTARFDMQPNNMTHLSSQSSSSQSSFSRTLPFHALPAGLYILTATTADGKVIQTRFVKS